MNDKILKPWLVLFPNGSIESAHCTCMAGLGEACSHVAAVAFYLHVKESEEVFITEKLCLWKIPIVKSKIIPLRIKDIDWGKQIKSYPKTKKLENIPALEGQGLISFLNKCNKAEPNGAILNIVQPFAYARVPKMFDNLPQPLSSLFDPKYKLCTLEDLKNVNITFHITKEQRLAIFEATVDQNKSYEWYKQRNGRITSSNFKSVCTTSVAKPSKTLINYVCYGTKLSFKGKPLLYGIENEDNARQSYCNFMKSTHKNVGLKKTGLMISLKSAIFGSSVDAIVFCDCCGTGCCEFKCPYRMHELNLNIEQFVNLKNCYLKKTSDGKLNLDKNHQYYYQVQMHMYCTETNFCDFLVWSKKDIY